MLTWNYNQMTKNRITIDGMIIRLHQTWYDNSLKQTKPLLDVSTWGLSSGELVWRVTQTLPTKALKSKRREVFLSILGGCYATFDAKLFKNAATLFPD